LQTYEIYHIVISAKCMIGLEIHK